MNADRPDALVKSALEKIVYFEARSEQLANDLAAARDEAERLKQSLAQAAQREIELRRQVAEAEVAAGRAHAERDEQARLNDALRAERSTLIGKLVDAARIHAAGRPDEEGELPFDLAGFIAELRGAALEKAAQAAAPAVTRTAATGLPPVATPAPAVAAAASPAPTPQRPAPLLTAPPLVPFGDHTLAAVVQDLQQQGRLEVSTQSILDLSAQKGFAGRAEESLFGFSVRELSSPEASARIRAAERLAALGQPAAAPALATALHAELEPTVLVALLHSFAQLARGEGSAVVGPLLQHRSCEVRLSALKALLTLDAAAAGPHLAAAMSDPDASVRRRASLLALTLSGESAQRLGDQAMRDSSPDVRALGALVLGAAGGGRARNALQSALRDKEPKVRRAAARSLSRLLGEDVSPVVGLDEAQRSRAVRRLSALPARTVQPVDVRQALHRWASAGGVSRVPPPGAPTSGSTATPDRRAPVAAVAVQGGVPARAGAAGAGVDPAPARPGLGAGARALAAAPGRSAVAVLEPPAVSPELCAQVLGEVRCAIRGRTLEDLVQGTGAPAEAVSAACAALVGGGQLIRRGVKLFLA